MASPRSCFFRHGLSGRFFLGALLVGGLTACTAMRVGLGMRVRLEQLPVTSLGIALPAQGIAPGEKQPLVVTLQGGDGSILKTEGEGKGKVLWEDLHVTSTLGTVDGKGMLRLPADPRLSEGRAVHVTVTAPSHPDLRAEMDVPLRYDRAFVAQFSGRDGASGMNGSDGLDGSAGSMGSTDLEHPSAGGDGTDGGAGQNGQDGWPGEDGPDLRVQVALKAGFRPLLQVAVVGAGRREFFLVDPQGGSLMIRADGGSGGSGGKGGRGGRGGSGGLGSPSGRSGSDGLSGWDGHDGNPGRAGSITVLYDAQATTYLKSLSFSNRSGNGRPGPTVALISTSVPALW